MAQQSARESQHASKPAVIKIGGALLENEDALSGFWPALALLAEDRPVVVVHGGGPQSTAMARKLGHEPRIVQGRRVTTDLDLAIVHWTICGELNTRLVARALACGVDAIGLTGIDGKTIVVRKRPPWKIEGQQVDFGWVGDVERADPVLLRTLLSNGLTPIVAPLGIDEAGQTYNVNADTVAHAIAVALEAGSLLLVTESGGVRQHAADEKSLIPEMDEALYRSGASAGWIKDGMLVKLKMAFEARAAGIPEVYILSPGDIFTKKSGTTIQ